MPREVLCIEVAELKYQRMFIWLLHLRDSTKSHRSGPLTDLLDGNSETEPVYARLSI